MTPPTTSAEGNLNNQISQRARNRTKQIWALVGTAVVILGILAFSLTRQESLKAAEVVRRAKTMLHSISSYHLRYKTTFSEPNGKPLVAYYDLLYKSPDKLKMEITQPGTSNMTWLIDGKSRWTYHGNSKAAFLSPISDRERNGNIGEFVKSPEELLKDCRKGYRYAGTSKVVGRQCDVLVAKRSGASRRLCIDRKTGILLQFIYTGQGRSERSEIVDFAVNQPVSDEALKLKLKPCTLTVKTPDLNPGLFRFTDAASPFTDDTDPYGANSDLDRIIEQGKAYKTGLDLYQPGDLPDGYEPVGIGTFGIQRTMPDGSVRGEYTKGFDTVYIDYMNPQTGDTIILTESKNEFAKLDGRELTMALKGEIKSFAEPFNYVILHWQAHDQYFSLAASNLSERDAVKIGESMQTLDSGPLFSTASQPIAPKPTKKAGKWRIILLVYGTLDKTKIDQAACIVKQRLVGLGIKDAQVKVVLQHRIQVITRTNDLESLENTLIDPKGMPVELDVFTQETVRIGS